MKFAVIVFPGSNCDHDAYCVLKNIGFDVQFVWHKERNLNSFDGILIPGGFSYGDYLRTGAIAKFSPIMKSVVEQSKKGKIIIGICNTIENAATFQESRNISKFCMVIPMIMTRYINSQCDDTSQRAVVRSPKEVCAWNDGRLLALCQRHFCC